jgi:hypothetical protein
MTSRARLIVIKGGSGGGGEPDAPQITQLELSACVTIENEIRLLEKDIRLLTARLREKRAYLRQCLKAGMAVEEGPLEGFASQIARGKFLSGK